MEHNGRIYQLVCEDGYYYIGSTKNDLRKRFYEHKMTSKRNADRKIYKHINNIGWDKVKIVLIEDYKYVNKQELVRKEYEHIIKNKNDKFCLNMNIGNTFDDEYHKNYREQNKDKIKESNKHYRENNTDTIKEQSKQYYEEHRDKIAEYKKQYSEKNQQKLTEYKKQYYEENKQKMNQKITCECGRTISKRQLHIHKQSKIHIHLLNNKP